MRKTTTGNAAILCRAVLVLLVLVCLPALPGGTAAANHARGGKAGPPWLLAAGDLRGEIEPCGCSPEGQMGGLPRRLSYLAKWLGKDRQGAVLVDLGNNFPPPSPQGRLKVKLIQHLLGRFEPDAILPGPNELAYGVAALQKGLPYLVSNDEAGGTFLPHRTVERGGQRIGIYGYLSPGEVYQGSQSRFRLLPAGPELLHQWQRQREREGHELALLLFRGSDGELGTILQAGLFDHVFSGNPFSDEMNQVVMRRVGPISVPQVPTKGQGMVRIVLQPGGAPFTVDWLTDIYPDHSDAKQPFADYDAQVKKLFFASLETKEKVKIESPYIGAAMCRTCHAQAGEIWEKSRHAGAIATLEKVGKQFDPECLACHVAGLNAEGYLSRQLTPHLAGVQCENCHGPGRGHMLNPKANRPGLSSARDGGRPARVGEPVCRTCHVGSHSPAFAFETYWAKIRHQEAAPSR
jgi:hypothetical protein